MSRLNLLSEVWYLIRSRRRWFVGPFILLLVVIGLIIVLAQGTALAPFIYTLF